VNATAWIETYTTMQRIYCLLLRGNDPHDVEIWEELAGLYGRVRA
jgi:Leu/Phe-tRNA-protein transferase